MKIHLSLGLFFTLFPLVFLIIGLSLGVATYNRINNATIVEGTIISHREKHDSDGFQYASIVEFKNLDGVIQKDTESVYSFPEPENIGKKVTVFINNKNQVTIGTFSNVWLLPIIFSAISIPFMIIGAIFIGIYLKTTSKIAYLRDYGRKIESTNYKIEQNRMIRINYKNPYYISSTFVVDGKEYKVKSEISLKPITSKNNSVEILYDPNDPDKNIILL